MIRPGVGKFQAWYIRKYLLYIISDIVCMAEQKNNKGWLSEILQKETRTLDYTKEYYQEFFIVQGASEETR